MAHLYTYAQLKNAVTVATAGTLDPNLTTGEIVNRAYNWLVCLHKWSWRRRPLMLSTVGITPTNVVRASDMVTVTSTAHGLIPGDAVRLINTVAPLQSMDGAYLVYTVPTSNTFTVQQLGPDESATAAGQWIPGFLNLPADFGALDSFNFAGFTGIAEPVEMAEIINMRAYPTQYGFLRYFFSVVARSQATAASASTYRMEIYPTPTTIVTNMFIGTYWMIPLPMTQDTDVPNIPSDMMDVLHRLCRAFGVSDQEERSGNDWELAQAMIQTAQQTDGDRQTQMGMLRTSLTQRYGSSPFVRRPIVHPFR